MLNIWWNVQYLSRAQQSLCLCCKGNVSKGWMCTPDSNAKMPAQSRQSKRTAALWLALQITWQQVHAISCWSRARALSLHNVQHKGYFFTLPDVLQNVVISSLLLCCVRSQTEWWFDHPLITQQPSRHMVTSPQKLVWSCRCNSGGSLLIILLGALSWERAELIKRNWSRKFLWNSEIRDSNIYNATLNPKFSIVCKQTCCMNP